MEKTQSRLPDCKLFRRLLPLDLAPVGASADRATDRLRSEQLNVEIIMELGRYLVSEAGIYVTKIIDVKISRGTRYEVCDGGLHHHLAASGNFGQVLRKNFPAANVDRH